MKRQGGRRLGPGLLTREQSGGYKHCHQAWSPQGSGNGLKTHLVKCRSDRFYSEPGNGHRTAVGLSRIYQSLHVHSQPCSALQKQDTQCLWLQRGNRHPQKTRCPSQRSMVGSEITAAWSVFQFCFAFWDANATDILCYHIFHH